MIRICRIDYTRRDHGVRAYPPRQAGFFAYPPLQRGCGISPSTFRRMALDIFRVIMSACEKAQNFHRCSCRDARSIGCISLTQEVFSESDRSERKEMVDE